MTSAKGASAQPGSATGASTPFATVNVSPFLWCVPLRGGAAVARPRFRVFFSRHVVRAGVPPRVGAAASAAPPAGAISTARVTERPRASTPPSNDDARRLGAAAARPRRARPEKVPRRADVRKIPPVRDPPCAADPNLTSPRSSPLPHPQENVEPRQRPQQRPHHLLVRARPHVHRVAARPARVHAAARHVQAQHFRVVCPAAQQLRLPQVPQRQVRVRRGGVRAG